MKFVKRLFFIFFALLSSTVEAHSQTEVSNGLLHSLMHIFGLIKQNPEWLAFVVIIFPLIVNYKIYKKVK